MQYRDRLPVSNAQQTSKAVADLMSPVTSSIGATQSLKDAADQLCSTEKWALVVTNLSHKPIGLIIAQDLQSARLSHPDEWQKKRCASLVQPCEDQLRPEDPIEGVIQHYREDGIRPMLVLNGESAVGVLYPEAVLRWCKEHQPAVFNELTNHPATGPSLRREGPL